VEFYTLIAFLHIRVIHRPRRRFAILHLRKLTYIHTRTYTLLRTHPFRENVASSWITWPFSSHSRESNLTTFEVIKATCTLQLRGARRSDALNVSREFWLRYIPVVRESLATIAAESNPFPGLRGRQTGRSHRFNVRTTQRGYARTARHVSLPGGFQLYPRILGNMLLQIVSS